MTEAYRELVSTERGRAAIRAVLNASPRTRSTHRLVLELTADPVDVTAAARAAFAVERELNLLERVRAVLAGTSSRSLAFAGAPAGHDATDRRRPL